MSIGSNPDGGYLVPAETESEIGRRLFSASPIRAIASIRQVSSAVYKKPFRDDERGDRLGR
jgi:HK97 family phage major capsid protein